MKNSEIQNALREYATEDTNFAIQSGSMAITETKKGVVTINYSNSNFQAYNNNGEELTGKINRELMINWIMNIYTIS